MDPVDAAYRYLGGSPKRSSVPLGRCCRCGQLRPVQPLHRFVSPKFNGWSELRDGAGLCASCGWAFASVSKKDPMWISRKSAAAMTFEQIHDHLLRPLEGIALVVPLSGRKHLLPYAQWGTVRVDDINLPWRIGDMRRLQILNELRREGVPASALQETTPPWTWLRHRLHEAELRSEQWRQLQPWRGTPYLLLAIKITHGRNQ